MTRGTIVLSFRGNVDDVDVFFRALRSRVSTGAFDTLSDAVKAFAVDQTWCVHQATQTYEQGEMVQHFAVDLIPAVEK